MNARTGRSSTWALALLFAHALSAILPANAAALESSVDRLYAVPMLTLHIVIRNIAFYENDSAYVVHDRATDTWSAVYFDARAVDGPYPLIYVEGPCLIVFAWDSPDRLHLSVSDPHLDLSDRIGLARNVTVILEGAWRMQRATAGAQLMPGSGETKLTFLIGHGRSFNVALERVGSP